MIEGIIAVSDEGKILLVNPAAHELLQIPSKDVIGRRFISVVRTPEINSLVEEILRRGGEGQVEIQPNSGSAKHLLARASLLPTESQNGILLTIHDQTEIRKLEGLRREFVANVSHELKTPLSAVKGYAETLQLGAIDDRDTALHFVNQIVAQSERLEELITDMLLLAKAQDGKAVIDVTDVNMRTIIEASGVAYEPIAKKRDIKFFVGEVPPSIFVRGEAQALLTVMNNLIGNAIRYTPEGGHVWVSCREEAGNVIVSVTDDGIGIPTEDQDRIFERFYRVEKARDLQSGGTGLGLAIVKNIVHSLKGTVELSSMPGKGSTFEISLPASKAQVPTLSSANA